MLVKCYVIKLINEKGEQVKVIRSAYEFTEEKITEILLEHKNEAMYCELSIQQRLHSDMLYKSK